MASFSSKFLKKRFSKAKDLQAFVDRASPGFAMVDKTEQGGASVAEPVISDGPQGFSFDLPAAQVTAAQTDRGASNYDEFNSTFGEYHGEAVVTARAVAGSKTDMDAYLRQLTEVMSSSLRKFGAIAARKYWGPVGGSIGRILAVNGGGTNGELTLTLRGDVFNFAPGMIVQAADSSGNGVPTTVRAGLGFIIAVYPNGDTDTTQVRVATSAALRIAGTIGLPSGWANNDFLFRNGDIAAAIDLSDVQIRSIQSWVRLTAATSGTVYNGVDVGQDERLTGIRISTGDLAGMGILDRCFLLLTELRAQSGAMDVDYIILGPRTWQQGMDEARTYGKFEFGKDPRLGVSALTILGATGECKIICDPYVAESDIWAVTSSNMKMYHYDGVPALDEGDGNELLRQTSAAAYAVRYHCFNCTTVNGKPWTFGRISSGN